MLLPNCCYGFAGGSLQGSLASYPELDGSGTSQSSSPKFLAKMATVDLLPRILCTQLRASPESDAGSRTRSAHRTAFYPEMIYSPSEKPREPLNEVGFDFRPRIFLS